MSETDATPPVLERHGARATIRLNRPKHLNRLQADDLDVLLARAGKEKFFRLRIARETQGSVFFENPVDGDADLVFIGTGFWLDRECD